RDRNVTGVQTCALPISGKVLMLAYMDEESLTKTLESGRALFRSLEWNHARPDSRVLVQDSSSMYASINTLPVSAFWTTAGTSPRSEERRVGKACSTRPG